MRAFGFALPDLSPSLFLRKDRIIRMGVEPNRLEIQAPADGLLAVDDALDALSAVDTKAAKLVKLRYFVGMTLPEAAELLGGSLRSAERLWTFSRAWLRDALRRSI